MSWFILIIAGLLEVVWALGLKYAQGFTKPVPSFITIAALVASIGLLGSAAKVLPIGTAYAVWVGIGVLGTSLGGMLLLGEPVSTVRVSLLALLVASIAGLKLTA